MYINTTTLQRITESEIRAANPNTSFAVPFTPPAEYAVVFSVPQPAYDAVTEGVREIDPVQVNNNWQQAWETYALDADTIAANQAAQVKRITEEVVYNTQKRLDTFAATRNYDSILSACTYATSPTAKFAAEGQYCVEARDATWAALYSILAEIEAGTRPMPAGYADVEALLPVLEWPVVS